MNPGKVTTFLMKTINGFYHMPRGRRSRSSRGRTRRRLSRKRRSSKQRRYRSASKDLKKFACKWKRSLKNQKGDGKNYYCIGRHDDSNQPVNPNDYPPDAEFDRWMETQQTSFWTPTTESPEKAVDTRKWGEMIRINGKTIRGPEVEELVKDKTFLLDKSTYEVEEERTRFRVLLKDGQRIIMIAHLRDEEIPKIVEDSKSQKYKLIASKDVSIEHVGLRTCGEDENGREKGRWTVPPEKIVSCPTDFWDIVDELPDIAYIGKDKVKVRLEKNKDKTITLVRRPLGRECHPEKAVTGKDGRPPVDEYVVVSRGAEEKCVLRTDEFLDLKRYTPLDKSVDFQQFVALDGTMYRTPKERVLQSLKS